MDRWHPLSEATNGQENILLMNEVGYDAATIGNNEGVGNSKEELNHLYDHAEFDIILDNLFDKIRSSHRHGRNHINHYNETPDENRTNCIYCSISAYL